LIDNSTIVAIATANGIGSISIIRLSGPKALEISKKITHRDDFQPRLATLSNIHDKESNLIDEALILYFKAPFSFTGEDVVEFQCHGGVAIANMLINEILKYDDARLAEPGEFSKRAFLNNKIDLSKAEAISKIIEARSEDAVRLLAKQLKGELKDFVNEIREDLLFMLAYTEVTIDYAEEDLPDDIVQTIERKIDSTMIKLDNTRDASKRREGMIEGFKVAIIGKPNVGKSSLLNKLLNFERAIISDIAGTTRDTIEESVRIGTHIIKIVDTAGIRNADDTIEKIGIEKSIQAIDEAEIVIALFDNSKVCDDEDLRIVELLSQNPHKQIVKVLNKADLENKFDTSKIDEHIEISTKQDIKPLIKAVEKILDENTHTDEMSLISKRQVDAVENTLYNIKNAKTPLETGELEFFAHYINEAILHISSITRPYDNDEMLDVMFGEFCLGK